MRGDRVLIISGPRYHQDDDGNPLPGNPPPGVDVSLLNVLEVEPQAELGRTRLKLEVLPKFPPRSQPARADDRPAGAADQLHAAEGAAAANGGARRARSAGVRARPAALDGG